MNFLSLAMIKGEGPQKMEGKNSRWQIWTEMDKGKKERKSKIQLYLEYPAFRIVIENCDCSEYNFVCEFYIDLEGWFDMYDLENK